MSVTYASSVYLALCGLPTGVLMSLLGPAVDVPNWVDKAEAYYSKAEFGGRQSVCVMKFPETGEASETNPGTLRIRLAASFRRVDVLGADGVAQGFIRPRGPGIGYAMHRSGEQVWALSNRSAVLRRHALSFRHNGVWDVLTPFFWWMNVVCSENGTTHVLGKVGHSTSLWQLWIQPGYDHVDTLAALAFIHLRWWRR